MQETIWQKKPTPSISNEIIQHYPEPIIHNRLAKQGIDNADAAQAFLDPNAYSPASPSELHDLDKAAARLWAAIQNGERIGVWGDFDVDGQTATSLLVEAIRLLNGDVVYHIPNRNLESHGIKLDYLKTFLEEQINILLTCDTGVSEHEAVHYAEAQGIDVIITDHHSLPDKLPDVFAIVNPQRLPQEHPLHELAGVGAAYKLIEALFSLAGQQTETTRFLDLVALGTVADVALLKQDNRYLVQCGLKVLQKTQRLGLKEIYRIKGLDPNTINETDIGFTLAPILNAKGRLDDANQVVEFLTSSDTQFIATFAASLNNLNEKRKLLTDQITAAVRSKIERSPEINAGSALVVEGANWHAGILGIVASRIVEKYQQPVILLTGDENTGYRGSARSLEPINIIKAIREQAHLLDHFGGHTMAAGLSLPAKNLAAFRKGFDQSVLSQIGDQVTQNIIEYDEELYLDQINLTFIQNFTRLEPFGAGNPGFIFCTKNLKAEKVTKIGQTGKHLKITFSDKAQNSHDAVWWFGDSSAFPEDIAHFDILYALERSSYKNIEEAQIKLIAVKTAEEMPEEEITSQSKLNLIDKRNEPTNLSTLLETYPDAAIWYEGSKKANERLFTRLSIGPTETLIIAFLPPDMNVVQKVLRTTQPQKIVFNPLPDVPVSINTLVKTVGTMLNYAIQKNQGILNTQRMAAAIGQRTATIEAVLNWYAASGKITLTRHPDTDPLVKPGGLSDKTAQKEAEKEINFLLKETKAFQDRLRNMNENQLHETHLSWIK